MNIRHDRENDSLYIDLSEKTAVDSREVAPGVVLDFGQDGSLVGIDIDHASRIVDLERLDVGSLPYEKQPAPPAA
jgi:uncharacterized protein YuzE